MSFSYRLPALRKWLTLYGDGFTDDEFSPIAYMDVSAWHAGLYLSHFPRISRLDLRAEGVTRTYPEETGANTKYRVLSIKTRPGVAVTQTMET